MERLYVSDNIGGFKEASDKDILSVASFAAGRQLRNGQEVTSVSDAKKLLVPLLAGKEHEVFCVAFLDPLHKLIAFEEMFRGSITQTPVYIREVMKRALELNASGIIMVHNHPSGNAQASDQDILTTLKMKMVGDVLEIQVLDHFVVAGDKVSSMRDDGGFNPLRMFKTMMHDLTQSLGGQIEIHEMENDEDDGNPFNKLKKLINKDLN